MFVYIGSIMRQLSCHPSKFYASLSRLRWIKRWGLMRNAEPENVMEHSWEVAVVAHALALIRNQYFMGTVDANAIATAALFHDASEVLTGDLPTPIKYFSNSLTTAYRQIEAIACDELISTLPKVLQASYQLLLSNEQQPEEHHQIIKAADTLSAYLKCLSELRTGNLEFTVTARKLESQLNASSLPEVAYFMQTFVPDFAVPFDGVLQGCQSETLPV
jgi:5'-deoxynucleotidase